MYSEAAAPLCHFRLGIIAYHQRNSRAAVAATEKLYYIDGIAAAA